MADLVDIPTLIKDIGFDLFVRIDPAMLVIDERLVQSCSPENCENYGTCWSCPPGAGTLEQRQAHLQAGNVGILVQTVCEDVDYEKDAERIRQAEIVHNQKLDQLASALRDVSEEVLEFTTGGCDICDPCSYPDAPCKQPEMQRLALSAHGVDVAATCQAAGMEYGFENGRVRFVGMVLYRQ